MFQISAGSKPSCGERECSHTRADASRGYMGCQHILKTKSLGLKEIDAAQRMGNDKRDKVINETLRLISHCKRMSLDITPQCTEHPLEPRETCLVTAQLPIPVFWRTSGAQFQACE